MCSSILWRFVFLGVCVEARGIVWCMDFAELNLLARKFAVAELWPQDSSRAGLEELH